MIDLVRVKQLLNSLNEVISEDSVNSIVDPIDSILLAIKKVRLNRRKLYGDKFKEDSNSFLLDQIRNKLNRLEDNLVNTIDSYSYESALDSSIDAINYIIFIVINNLDVSKYFTTSDKLQKYINEYGINCTRNGVKVKELNISIQDSKFLVNPKKVNHSYIYNKLHKLDVIDLVKTSRRNFIQFDSSQNSLEPECISSINFLYYDKWHVNVHFRSSDIEKLDTDIYFVEQVCEYYDIKDFVLNLNFDNLHIYL